MALEQHGFLLSLRHVGCTTTPGLPVVLGPVANPSIVQACIVVVRLAFAMAACLATTSAAGIVLLPQVLATLLGRT